MAPEDVETFDHWRYLPEREGFVIGDSHPDFAWSIDRITEGRIRQRGNILFDGETGRIRGRVAPRTGSTLERGNRGTTLLNNRVTMRELFEPRASLAIPRLYIQGELQLPDGTNFTPAQRFVTLVGRREIVYVNDAIQSGRGRYTRLQRGLFGEAGPPLSNEFGRLATHEDLIVRAMAGYIGRNAPTFIDRALATGVQTPDGGTITTGSELVRAIVAALQAMPIMTYILTEPL